MAETLKRIAELLDDGEGPSLHDLLTEDPARLTVADRYRLRIIVRWVFVEEAELRALLASSPPSPLGDTPEQQEQKR